jgi:hypothetical protein
MKHSVLAIVGIVFIVALAGSVLSQGKRAECLQDCRADGDYCAEKAYRAHANCRENSVVCESEKKNALRACAQEYDSCRYACDLPPF